MSYTSQWFNSHIYSQFKTLSPKPNGLYRLPSDESVSMRPATATDIVCKTSSYRWPEPIHYAGPINGELSQQEYENMVLQDKKYVSDKEDNMSDILQDTKTDFTDDEKEIEDMDDEEIKELIHQILSIPDERSDSKAKLPKQGLVSILKLPSKRKASHCTHQRKVKFALN